MQSQLDSLTQDELEAYTEAKQRIRHVRHTTGCIGCDEEQVKHNNRTSLCEIHTRLFQRYQESI